MAKSKKRKRVKKRVNQGAAPAKKSGGGSGGGGSIMGMRSGFKGIAGSMTGKKSSNPKTKRVVDIFWWVLTAGILVVAGMVLYNRFSGS